VRKPCTPRHHSAFHEEYRCQAVLTSESMRFGHVFLQNPHIDSLASVVESPRCPSTPIECQPSFQKAFILNVTCKLLFNSSVLVRFFPPPMANEDINEAFSVLIVSTKSNVHVPRVQFRSLHAPSSRLQAIVGCGT